MRQLRLAGISQPPAMQEIPNGCDECDLTGYKGRIGIYEMLALDDSVRAAIRDGGNGDDLRRLARRDGMKLMHEYALEQVCGGLTTLDEVERVVPIERMKIAACTACQRDLAGNFLFCPYCGAHVTVEAEPKPSDYEVVAQDVVNR